ncbi:MAG: polyprenyl synthetase family protein [Ardenticatenaceae bacterium]|nr:polyprenyl synthetase family protein [Ardenticatenaceae bacterium]
MSNDLTQFFQEMLPAIEAEMKAVLQAGSTDDFYGMMHYHMGWADEQFQPAHVKSGKRIRPILCLLTCAAAGGDWRQALPAAAAVEILHNFSLVHDDIEDASPTRRGRATMWQIWGIELAINTGDAMFALAHIALGRLQDRGVDAAIVVQALRRFDEMCVRLTQGQHADMSFEKREQVSVDEYMEMITGKTAVLLSHCAELGALVAGCDAATVNNYAAFGRDLGLAFQVIDDILGIWGDEDLTGKSAATDIATKKKTLPVLHGLAQDESLRQLYQQSEANDAFIQQVVAQLDQTGSRDFANSKASTYSHSAVHHLEATNPRGAAGLALQQLTDMLLKRDF